MSRGTKKTIKNCLVGAASILAIALTSANAWAEDDVYAFDIDAQPLDQALIEFSQQSKVVVMAPGELTAGKQAPAVKGDMEADEALEKILSGSGLKSNERSTGAYTITLESASLGEETPPAPFRLAQVDQEESTRAIDSREQEDEEARQDVIVVTGTNIRGAAPVGAPLLQFDREAIELSGVTTTQQFLQTLPQNFGGGASEDTNLFNTRNDANTNLGFGTGVNLRGLGTDSTLVLINGRRTSPGGQGGFTDVSQIPLSAIERIDVLPDGASAVYGSDAVGGVVNIVLREEFDGAETRVRYGSVTSGSRDEVQVGQVVGKSWNKGDVLLSYDFTDRSKLGAGDRDFSSAVDARTNLLPSTTQHNAMIVGSYELSERVRLFSTGSYSDRDVERMVFVGTPPPELSRTSVDVTHFGGTAGLEIDLTDKVTLEVSGLYSETESSVETLRLETLAETLNETKNELAVFNAKVDGELVELPGGAMSAAIGLQYQQEDYRSQVTSGAFTLEPMVFSREVTSGFAEVYIPIIGEQNSVPGINEFTVSAAVRHDDYEFFGSTTNPRVGARWEPFEGLSFRSSYSTSFRAPLLRELDTSFLQVLTFVVPDPASASGTANAVFAFGAGPEPDIGPEESTNWTVGIDFQPESMPGLSASLTYFDVEFEDRIASTSAFFDAFTDPVFSSIVTRDPDPNFLSSLIGSINPQLFFDLGGFDLADTDAFIDNRLGNISSTHVDGLDFDVSYSRQTDIGQIRASLSGNYMLSFDEQITASALEEDLVDTIYNPVDLRLRSGVTISRGDGFSGGLFVNYTDDYTDDQFDVDGMGVPFRRDLSVSSWTTVDVSLNYDTGDRIGGLMNDTTFSLSVLNLLDEDPPFVDDASAAEERQLGFDPENADPLGRFISLQVTKRW